MAGGIRERQLEFVLREIRAAEAAGHTLNLRSWTKPGRDTLSYLASCSCGWEQPKAGGQSGSFIKLIVHVAQVVPLTDEDMDEARRVGLDLRLVV